MSARPILLIVEAEEGLTFFQSFIVPREAIADLDSAVRRIGEYLKVRGATLVEVERADVVEIDQDQIPEAWLAKASPEHAILACGGRTWVDPSLEDEAPTKGPRAWFSRIVGRVRGKS